MGLLIVRSNFLEAERCFRDAVSVVTTSTTTEVTAMLTVTSSQQEEPFKLTVHCHIYHTSESVTMANYEYPEVCIAKHYSSQALCYDHVHRSNICYSENLNKITVHHSIL